MVPPSKTKDFSSRFFTETSCMQPLFFKKEKYIYIIQWILTLVQTSEILIPADLYVYRTADILESIG